MQAIIQVASKPPVSYQLLQIPMRRCDHANIHLLGTGAAQSFKLTLLEDPQQLRLDFEWNVPYFIEEHGALGCNGLNQFKDTLQCRAVPNDLFKTRRLADFVKPFS